MFAALSTRLWFLQVLATEVYAEEAQNNSVRTATTDALRGEIWTADQYAKQQGRRTARRSSRTASSLEVRVDKQELERERPSRAGAAARCRRCSTSPSRRSRQAGRASSTSTTSRSRSPSSWTKRCAFYIEEHARRVPRRRGASTRACARTRWARRPPHMLGWVGQIDARAASTRRRRIRNYGANDLVGQDRPRGHVREVAAGPQGRAALRRELRRRDDPRPRRGRPPTPGDDLVLTLDCDVAAGRRGALCRTASSATRHDLRRGRPASTSRRTPAPWSCSTPRRAGSRRWRPGPTTTPAGSSEG